MNFSGIHGVAFLCTVSSSRWNLETLITEKTKKSVSMKQKWNKKKADK